jgi:hypothetical protein
MKGGDYLIHVFVQEGHSFKLDGSQTVNPIIEVSCCDKSKYTNAMTDIPCNSKRLVKWKEHIFFEPK